MKKYLLFDLDGTLTDPKIGITTCVQYALKSFDIDEPDLDRLEPFIGPPLKESFMQFYGMDEAQAEKAVAKYRERFTELGLFENEVYKGIPEMLRRLQAMGMHLAVASSKPTVFVERILKHFHLDSYFEVVVGSELDGTRVNKDEVVCEALRRLFQGAPIQREQVYMIGDRRFDVEGAKVHGIESVAVAYGYGDVEELKEAKADYIVLSVEELKDFLLRDSREECYGREKKASVLQLFAEMALPLLLFIVVRSTAMYLLFALGAYLPERIGRFFVLYDEVGGFDGYSVNAGTMMAALSYVAAALAIRKRAAFYIERAAVDTRLNYLKRESVMSYVLIVLAGAGAVLGLNLLFHLTGFIGASAAYQEVAVTQYAATFLVGLFCYGFISPLAEELMFRGVLFNFLRRLGNTRVALVASAVIFGVYHMNAVQGVYGFLMACLITYGYVYFGSFKIPVILHMLSNILAYSLSYLPASLGGFVGWPVCIVSLAVSAACLWMLHRKKRI